MLLSPRAAPAWEFPGVGKSREVFWNRSVFFRAKRLKPAATGNPAAASGRPPEWRCGRPGTASAGLRPRAGPHWKRGLPHACVRHRCPGLGRRQRAALLEKLDRDGVRRADEGHVPVPRRAVDRHARVHQLLANRVDVVDPVGEMAEISPASIDFRIPVVGEFDERRLVLARPFGIAGAARNTRV